MGPPDVYAGKRVLILNGPHRDTEALLEGIDEKNFRATLTLDSVSWLFEQQVYVTMNSTALFGCTQAELLSNFTLNFRVTE